MRIVHQLVRLLETSAHSILDSAEDRQRLARHHICEARQALQDKREQIAQLKDSETRLTSQLARLAALIQQTEGDVELALSHDQKDLARAAVHRLIPLSESHQRLSHRLLTLRDEQTRLSLLVATQEKDLEILSARYEAELATAETAESLASIAMGQSAGVSRDQVELELLRRHETAAARAVRSEGDNS